HRRCGRALSRGDCPSEASCTALTGVVQAFAVDVNQSLPAEPFPACPHDECAPGPPMGDPVCEVACVVRICRADPYGCGSWWDQVCVSEVASVCGFDGCPVCGNGVVEAPFEVCDPGASGGCAPGQVCSLDCGGCEAACGDGLVGPDEKCDPPGSPAPNCDPGY